MYSYYEHHSLEGKGQYKLTLNPTKPIRIKESSSADVELGNNLRSLNFLGSSIVYKSDTAPFARPSFRKK